MTQDTVFVIKADGKRELFDIQKLEYSLRQAKASDATVTQIVSHILQEVRDGMATKEIYKHAFELLHRLEHSVALRYSLKHALMELGPSGFPFEKFVAEIFKSLGYEAITDQMVAGRCVQHEVDVVAWKGDELIISEVKFHNELGLKSDLKVVLYVWARFEDLEKVTFNYGGANRPMKEGWLITNTKFTTSALKYAECQNMKIVGWNYPLDGNLHDLITDAKLHPITCLSALSDKDKKILIEQNIILCKDLKQNPSVFKSLNISEAERADIMAEIASITK